MEEKTKDENKPFLSRISDRVKIAFIRFWFVGLIYYLVGWGTSLGLNENPLDFIFLLAIICAACLILIFNPITHYMFDIERNGKVINKDIAKRKIYQGVLLNLVEFLRCFIVTYLIYLTYQLINQAIMNLAHIETIVIPGEPILYGTFFTLYYELLTYIKDLILRLFSYFKNKKEEKKE